MLLLERFVAFLLFSFLAWYVFCAFLNLSCGRGLKRFLCIQTSERSAWLFGAVLFPLGFTNWVPKIVIKLLPGLLINWTGKRRQCDLMWQSSEASCVNFRGFKLGQALWFWSFTGRMRSSWWFSSYLERKADFSCSLILEELMRLSLCCFIVLPRFWAILRYSNWDLAWMFWFFGKTNVLGPENSVFFYDFLKGKMDLKDDKVSFLFIFGDNAWEYKWPNTFKNVYNCTLKLKI